MPELGNLRIASPADILRIGVVAASVFRYSPIFPWQRPYHTTYPADTLLSYRHIFTNVIKNPEYVVLVAVDRYEPDEAAKTEAAIPPGNGATSQQEVIVGVAAWKLPPGLSRVGEFNNETGLHPQLEPNLNRDQDPEHSKRMRQVLEEAEQRHFHDKVALDMLAVHPAYWCRGHGAALVGWGLDLANIDQVKLGVLAAATGRSLYARLGFTLVKDVDMNVGLAVGLMIYDPTDFRQHMT